MTKRLAAIAIVLAAGAAAGLLASPSNGAENSTSTVCGVCEVALTGAGPSPTKLTTFAGLDCCGVRFWNRDSVSHTVVFANGLCSFTLAPNRGAALGGPGPCNDLPFYVGSYAYTVDGKFQGTVVAIPLPRSVTLTARTHTIRLGRRLTLHGHMWVTRGQPVSPPSSSAPGAPPVLVFARPDRRHPFKPLATVYLKSMQFIKVINFTRGGVHYGWRVEYGWKLNVQPDVTTTYIARVTTQRLCEFPASRCAHPHGQVWANATSGPFTVRIGGR